MQFGEHRCFLLQINSYQGVAPVDCPDPWLKYLKKHPKVDGNQTADQSGGGSAPRTPQDIGITVTSMPYAVHVSTLETPPSGIISEEVVDHPLSPVQEHATEAIVIISFKYDNSKEYKTNIFNSIQICLQVVIV